MLRVAGCLGRVFCAPNLVHVGSLLNMLTGGGRVVTVTYSVVPSRGYQRLATGTALLLAGDGALEDFF